MDYVQKLQILDPEKLIELCRMHLSFTLDLHDDEFAALMDFKREKKKSRSYFSRLVKDKTVDEPMPLNQETISHIYQIIEFLGRDINVCKEGLFRKTGSLTRQNELKTLLRLGENIDFSSGLYSVHDCACVLKSFLAEMPEPLLSEAHYSAHCQITDMSKNGLCVSSSQMKSISERQLKSTKLLLLLLPTDNYCLLKYLLLLLYQIQSSEQRNKMSSENLATLFAPHIMCPRKMSPEELKDKYPRLVKCVTFLIENAPSLFEPPVELVRDIKMHMKGMSFEGQIQATSKENEAVKTLITFCDQTKVPEMQSSDYTSKALSELQSYIETLPDTTRKRKLMKKFQKENNMEPSNEPRRKHFRSRSVGDVIKKHFMKNSYKRREGDFSHSTFTVNLQAANSTDSIPSSSCKAASMEALYLENKEPSRFAELRKNLLRASRKKKVQKLMKVN